MPLDVNLVTCLDGMTIATRHSPPKNSRDAIAPPTLGGFLLATGAEAGGIVTPCVVWGAKTHVWQELQAFLIIFLTRLKLTLCKVFRLYIAIG